MKKYIYAILIGLIAFPILVQAEMPAEKYEKMPAETYQALLQIRQLKVAIRKASRDKASRDNSSENAQSVDEKQLERIDQLSQNQNKVPGYMVILFTTPNCSHCATAKDNMKKKGSDGTSFESRLKAKGIPIYEISSTENPQSDLYYSYILLENGRLWYPRLVLLKDGLRLGDVVNPSFEEELAKLEKNIK